jgi:putative ABC transport system permease protein
VEDAEARTMVAGQIRIDAKTQQRILFFAIPDFNNIRINKVLPQGAYQAAPAFQAERGHFPPGPHEIVLERSSLLIPGLVPAGLKVGDKIEITINDQVRELTVAGLAHESVFAPAPFVSAAYGYIDMDTLEWLTGVSRSNSIYITVAENKLDQQHIKDVVNTITSKIEGGGRTVYSADVPVPGKHPIQDIFNGILLLLNLLGFGSLFLSGFLVVNIINAVLAQQIRQIGIMKAIGARTTQMIAMYLAMVLLFGILALIVAIPLAAMTAARTSMFLAGFVNVDFPDFSIPPGLLITEILIGLGLPLIASLFPIWGGVRVTVREALSDYGVGKATARVGRIDRLIDRVRGVSRPTLISFRNTFRRKGRLALTLTTLVLAGTIFISVNSIHASMLATLDDAFKNWQFDVMMPFAHPYRTDLVEPIAKSVPGVTTVESWGLNTVRRVRADKTESEGITMFALPANTKMVDPAIVEGRWLLPDDENAIVVNLDLLKSEKDIQVGDDIKLKIQNRESVWHVVGKMRTVGQFGGIGLVYVNYPYYTQVIGQIGRAQVVQVLTAEHTAQFQDKVKTQLEELYKDAGIRLAGQTLTSQFLRQSNEIFFNIITAMLMVMAVLMAIVGGLGLMGTMSINVLERTREIGVMRAIGASNGAVRGVVMTEGVIIGLLSGLIAAVFSYPLAQIICGLVGVAIFQLPLTFQFSISGTILWLIIVAFLSALASFLPAYNASRLTVREVLAYE